MLYMWKGLGWLQFFMDLKIERGVEVRQGIPMTDLLTTLGDDWHTPHVYAKLILSVVPNTTHLEDIEHCLTGIYVDSHYDFKLYKNTSKYTVYDLEIDVCEGKKKNILDQQAREEEAFENLCKKLQEIQVQLPEHAESMNQEEEEEDEEEEEIEHAPQKMKGAQPKPKSGQISKATLLAEREKMQKLKKQYTTTKSCMATSQEKLVALQAELDELERKSIVYRGYQQANWYYLTAMRNIVLNYEKNKDIQELIQRLENMLVVYNDMRCRVAPQGPCQGLSGLCKTHYLPLHPTKWVVYKVTKDNVTVEQEKVTEAKCQMACK